MRVWRRIANDPRFGRTSWTDSQIRSLFGVPSIDTHMRRCRLIYFSRLARTKFDALHAILQQRGRVGQHLPWVALIINDLAVLKFSLPHKFELLPSPSEQLAPYWCLARDYPQEWKALVKQLVSVEDDVQEQASPPLKLALGQHSCNVCSKTFASSKQLASHKWSQHKIRSDI
eukprot:12018750-Karenia_brevis.AAC.1